MFRRIKDKLYYYFVQKNWGVCREYEPYVNAHREEHAKARWKHWWMLIRLNWHYRIMRKSAWLYLKPKSPAKKMPAKQNLPYLDGAESELCKRPLPIHLAMQLISYDVISFDIFDTLLLRPFDKPTSLFYIIGKRLNLPEFYQLRIDAEKRAREIALSNKGTREITIYDIYEIIETITGLPKELGVSTEFKVEMDYCIANPYIQRVYQLLKEQGKTIIIVSDMYFPRHMMNQLLAKNGFTGYEKLYVSCDYGCNKHGKGIYKYVLHDFKGKTIIHIGDNYKSDIQCAEESGLKTFYYRSVNVAGNPYRADGMTDLIGSAYKGVVNVVMHNGIKQYNPYYEYGFIYGGLYVFGFCNWIYQKAMKENVDKVLFLSRDGAIYQRVFNEFFSDIPSDYFLWSRIANSKYTFKRAGYMSFENAVRGRVGSVNPYTVSEFLVSLELGELRKYLGDYGLKEETILTQEIVPQIEQFFHDHTKHICDTFSTQLKCVKETIVNKVGDAKKVAFVDVGWLGSGAMGLKFLIEKDMKLDCSVLCWQAAAISSPKAKIEGNLLDGTIDCYLMSSDINRVNFDSHRRVRRALANVLFELFTQDVTPSYSGMNNNGEFMFHTPEVENYDHIRDIHNGIFEFSKLYFETFKKDSYMHNISGYDAYLPFRRTLRDMGFFKKNYSDFVFPNIIGNEEVSSSDCLGDWISRAGY